MTYFIHQRELVAVGSRDWLSITSDGKQSHCQGGTSSLHGDDLDRFGKESKQGIMRVPAKDTLPKRANDGIAGRAAIKKARASVGKKLVS